MEFSDRNVLSRFLQAEILRGDVRTWSRLCRSQREELVLFIKLDGHAARLGSADGSHDYDLNSCGCHQINLDLCVQWKGI